MHDEFQNDIEFIWFSSDGLADGFGDGVQSIDDDPSQWKVNDSLFIEYFLRKSTQQDPDNLDLSKSERLIYGSKRSCTRNIFFRKNINGEKVQRSWIHYSETLGQIFCRYCRLFSDKRCGTFIDDWKHTNLIDKHETSKLHCDAATVFIRRNSEIGNLDSLLTKQLSQEVEYWRDILKRVLSAVRFLASRGLPFRGANQEIGSTSNGNYLGVLELIAEYDPLLRSHLENYGNKGKGSISYLSANIAKEFLHVLAEEVRTVIKSAIHRSKYYALIVDSTPDVSHVDQLTIVLRYVDEKGFVHERFLAFLSNTGHKGQEMETAVIDFLTKNDFTIINCRGQSYDNASNMSGTYKGLQARIKEICGEAVYIPCGGHTLNLRIVHAVETSDIVARFFLFMQNIYVFFSGSTKRWEILVKHLQADLSKRNDKHERLLVPKRLNHPRWSARADACRALKAGYGSYISALNEISENDQEKAVSYFNRPPTCPKYSEFVQNARIFQKYSKYSKNRFRLIFFIYFIHT